ncbi:Ctr copper transporter [Podospora fimiseda]|uniref:Copper transport protein n=1 Tax=Podospora fimiseda TaxID=252190 RepID=A0AAN7BVK3_9PEZI|nr:Ctr copper transporter [Podospora fimiseda]
MKQMLLNWNTINSCFLSQRIQIRSTPGMAAMCITVLLIAFMLEGLRRAVKEYDRHLVKKHLEKRIASKRIAGPGMDISLTAIPPANGQQQQRPPPVVPVKYRPSFWEQFTRALLMTMTFILAYLLMLLGMYYNGFVLISIFLGVFFGIFVFTWGHLGGLGHAGHDNDMPSSMGEITMCCG